MKHIATPILLLAGFLFVSAVPAQAVTSFSENFSASKLNTSRWQLVTDRGTLVQSSARLNFISTTSTGVTDAYIALKGIQPTYNENWEVLVDVVNTAGKDTWVGFAAVNGSDSRDSAGLELYVQGSKKYVLGDYTTDDIEAADVLKSISSTKTYLRITFSKTTKDLTFWYRTSTSAAWTKHSTFSTKNSTSATRRGNWRMSNTSKFTIGLYGGGERSSVPTGKMYHDNFVIRNLK